MDSIYGDMAEAMNDVTMDMFRDYIARSLGPSPFVPKWPVTRIEAEDMADKLIEHMKAQPDKGAKIMDDFYRLHED